MPEYEEGQNVDVNDLPVLGMKSFQIVPGHFLGYEMLLVIATMLDPDTKEESGMIFYFPAEDAMRYGKALNGVGATITPVSKQLQRLAAQENEENR